jgi:hypothetical protein
VIEKDLARQVSNLVTGEGEFGRKCGLGIDI